MFNQGMGLDIMSNIQLARATESICIKIILMEMIDVSIIYDLFEVKWNLMWRQIAEMRREGLEKGR